MDKLLNYIWARVKRHNYYTLAILLTLIAGGALAIVLSIFAYLNEFLIANLPDWLLFLIFPPFFVSQLVSGVGYTGRWGDILSFTFKNLFSLQTYKNLWVYIKENCLGEFTGLCLGIVATAAVTAVQVVFHGALPAVEVLHTTGGIVLQLIMNLSAFCGLGSRLGKTRDYAAYNKEKEKENRGFFGRATVNYVCGLTGGFILFLTFAILVTVFLGATTVATGGLAAPVWVGASLFIVGTASVGASAGGYVGRGFDAAIGNRTLIGALCGQRSTKIGPDGQAVPNTLWDRINGANKWEARLTLIGITGGLIMAVGLIAGGITALPFFGSGLPPLVSGIVLFAFCISAMGGLGNRLGAAIDKAGQTAAQKKTQQQVEQNDATWDNNPGPRPPPPGPSAGHLVSSSPVLIRKQVSSLEGKNKHSQGDNYDHTSVIVVQNEYTSKLLVTAPQPSLVSAKNLSPSTHSITSSTAAEDEKSWKKSSSSFSYTKCPHFWQAKEISEEQTDDFAAQPTINSNYIAAA